jgi:uncharacterized protein (TIGR02444 family)
MNAIDRDGAWRYILGVYARPGVADDLLRQQQETGLDIVLHLFLMYAREELKLDISAAARAEAEALVKPWRENVVGPLRSLRHMLKDLPSPAGTGESKESLRQAIKQSELKSEQTQFLMLCQWLDTLEHAAPQ